MKRYKTPGGVVWFQISFVLIVVLTAFTACGTRNYFLVNSDMELKYNRTTGQFQLVWNSSLKHHGSNPDSMPLVVSPGRVSVESDSIVNE